MGKHFNKYAVIVLSILLAELINLYALSLLNHYRSEQYPYRSTAITMAVTVCVFYPTLKFLHKYLKSFSGKLMKHSAKVAGSHLPGRIAGFSLVLAILFLTFSYVLYQCNPLLDLKKYLLERL